MEGSESEEVKSVKRGSPECLQVKSKRVDKKKKKKHGASRLRKGTDVSQGEGDMAGGSDRHQVKRKRVEEEEESFSWLQRCTDASSKGEIAGGSEGSPECLQVKHKRVDKKKKKKKLGLSWVEGGVDASQGSESEELKSVKRGTEGSPECLQVKRKRVDKKKKRHGASRLRKGTDVSQGDMAGGSDRHQVKSKGVEEGSFSWLRRGTKVSQGEGDMAGGSDRHQVKRKRVEEEDKESFSRLVAHAMQCDLIDAKMALEFYEKSQDDADFEILKVLHVSDARLRHPESVSGHLWSHISFIAKPRKADCNVSPKHFFGEFFTDDDSGKIHVTYCSTFQPSDDPGFNHGCIFCPLGLKFHPSNGYCVGRPPWHRRKVVYGHPSRLRKGTDVSQGDMAGGSDRQQVKRKRVEKESFSWLQRCTDASSKGEIAGGSEHRQVKRKRVKHKRLNENDGGLSWLVEYRKQLALEHAKMALEFYEKSQDDAEFEILEVLNVSDSRLQHPGSVCGHLWSHISFIAKPRKADCNVSPKHFFAEFFRDDDSGQIHVTYCSTFQPSDDPGFNHGCMLCSLGQKFHESNGYCVGRPPWH